MKSIKAKTDRQKSKTVAIIVAHPDDETLWAGGTILKNPAWQCFVVCLCRASDADRAPRFYKTLDDLTAEGIMGDLDDGPEQRPLDSAAVERTILDLLPAKDFDLVITHNPSGEYTRHIRHEEAGKAVILLWRAGKISMKKLWVFAYEDGNKAYYPRAVESASVYGRLSKEIWQRKYRLITETYGFEKSSWEAETTPRAESFWEFANAFDANNWLKNGGGLV